MFEIPILFCTFNRLNCTKKTFSRIREIKPSKLYLLSDGARERVRGEKEKVNEVRKYVENHIDWECQVYKNYAGTNMGCGKRMSSGISWAFENEEKLIILEDDCFASIVFFDYCKELLNMYENNNNVMVIGGYNPLGKMRGKDSFVFTPFVEIWGWATWKRVWQEYDFDILEWGENKITPYMKKIMNKKECDHFTDLFKMVYLHKLDTWDYQLQYLIFQKGGLAIVPCANLVKNIGFGFDATHTKEVPTSLNNKIYKLKFPLQIPLHVNYNKRYNKQILKEQKDSLDFIEVIQRFLKIGYTSKLKERN